MAFADEYHWPWAVDWLKIDLCAVVDEELCDTEMPLLGSQNKRRPPIFLL
ncbi:uncharacterized protein DNG_06414 [Cephalotrichum gorgonifer]|uniref:Uncharacterized protein n=1 Tax=Cephalotrichum gorgonifer TaxID=2041049 RepID=A0AAE8MZS1_9PEZI|nr:uncharacterized protein DNG_06414 [Cephalotrichum gorgonifer]